jgi:hypothetical protein
MKKTASIIAGSLLFITSLFTAVGLVPLVATAQTDVKVDAPPAAVPLSFKVPNPLGSNTTTLDGFFANVLDAIVLLLTPVIVIMLVYCGFLFVSAQGKEEELTKAKSALMYTLIGAAIVLGAKGLAEVLKNTVTCLASSGSC